MKRLLIAFIIIAALIIVLMSQPIAQSQPLTPTNTPPPIPTGANTPPPVPIGLTPTAWAYMPIVEK